MSNCLWKDRQLNAQSGSRTGQRQGSWTRLPWCMIGHFKNYMLLMWYTVTLMDDTTHCIQQPMQSVMQHVCNVFLFTHSAPVSRMMRSLWHSRPRTLKLSVWPLRTTSAYCHVCKISDTLYRSVVCRQEEHFHSPQWCDTIGINPLSFTLYDVFGMENFI